jgi:hypothetical protein
MNDRIAFQDREIPLEYAIPARRQSPFVNPLEDVALEESVLSSMMDGRKVTSLSAEHFTSDLRADVYELLRSGTDYASLDDWLAAKGYDAGERAYLTDIYLTPNLPHAPLIEAVAELKRLAVVRRLCEAVDTWRERAPHMTHDKALRELGKAIRGEGAYAKG